MTVLSERRSLMKKFILMFIVLFLAACGSNTIDLKDVGTIRINDIKLSPQTATIDEDGYLNVTVKWTRGTDEDSMNKATFAQSGILFFAEQDGQELESITDNSTRMFDEVYDTTENNLYLKFKLENEDNDVEITVQDVVDETGETFTVEINK